MRSLGVCVFAAISIWFAIRPIKHPDAWANTTISCTALILMVLL